ncbi:hypothetical protein ACOMHN_045370 [Nucella lapillus]
MAKRGNVERCSLPLDSTVVRPGPSQPPVAAYVFQQQAVCADWDEPTRSTHSASLQPVSVTMSVIVTKIHRHIRNILRMCSKVFLCLRFPLSSCKNMIQKRPGTTVALMSPLLLLGLYVMVHEARATDEGVDFQRIADLSAEIDHRSSYTTWLHGGPDRPGGVFQNRPHPQQPSSPLTASRGAASQDTGPQDARASPGPSYSLAVKPGKSHPAEVKGHSRQKGEDKAAATSLEDDFRKSKELHETEKDMLSLRHKRSPPFVDAVVTHMSAKKLAKREDDLAKRRQSEPEHKLYNEDLLLRRLKTLLQNRKHGSHNQSPQRSVEEESNEDSWEHELRIRRQLADRAAEYGLQKKKERLANPDPYRPLSVLERIHKDAEEILQRRAQEKEYLKKMLKNKAGAKTDSLYPKWESKEKGENTKKEQAGSAGAVQIMTQGEGAGSSAVSMGLSHPAQASAADILQRTRPVVSGHSHLSSRQRRKSKKLSRALVHALTKQRRLQ